MSGGRKFNKYVLALNKAWLPVDIISYKDAFRLMCKEHAKALETVNGTYVTYSMEEWMCLKTVEPYDTLNTVAMEISVPEIVILHDYGKIPNRVIQFSKHNLLIRDDYKCAYCGCDLTMDTSTIDHIMPSSKGGITSWDNCTSSCKDCNHAKGDELPVGQYKPKKIAKEPVTSSPIYQMTAKKCKDIFQPDSWSKFLFR